MRADRLAPVLLGVAVIGVAASCRTPLPEPPDPGPWRAWRAAHLDPSGRVIDDGQAGISHSEGQAWGMLLATVWRDERTFDRIWSWTRRELAVREDGLLAWRWEPAAGGGGAVTDENNATDGDLLAAWALARAARVFGRRELRDEARSLAVAIRTGLVRRTRWGPVLLPGRDGFVREGVLTINLSYWVFPAFEELDSVDPSRTWRRLSRTGRVLLGQARFGDAMLPPDWLALDGGLGPAPERPPRFGWDAMRIPLYLAWAGQVDEPLFAAVDRLWSSGSGPPPAWIDLETGEVGGVADAGVAAVHRLVRRALGLPVADVRPDVGENGYYADTLVLLALSAERETARG